MKASRTKTERAHEVPGARAYPASDVMFRTFVPSKVSGKKIEGYLNANVKLRVEARDGQLVATEGVTASPSYPARWEKASRVVTNAAAVAAIVDSIRRILSPER